MPGPYTLSVAGNAEPVNQLMDTIENIVPPLAVMVVFLSIIGAVLYSRYVTKPVIEISRVSEKMSGLDFTWDCTESRSDELGILAHSLNELSRKLSSALNDLQVANSQLEVDIERERMLEQAREYADRLIRRKAKNFRGVFDIFVLHLCLSFPKSGRFVPSAQK